MLYLTQSIQYNKILEGIHMKLLNWILSEMEKRDKMIKKETLFKNAK